jgi:hypothetical protein
MTSPDDDYDLMPEFGTDQPWATYIGACGHRVLMAHPGWVIGPCRPCSKPAGSLKAADHG